MLNVYFKFNNNGDWETLAITAETIKEAKEKAKSISAELVFDGYDEIVPDPFEGQKIAWICAKDADELTFPFKQLKKELSMLLRLSHYGRFSAWRCNWLSSRVREYGEEIL